MKIYAYVIIILALIAAIGGTYATGHSSGYDKRDAEIRDDAIIAQNEAIEKRMAEWIETQAQAEPVIVVEEKIVEKIRVIEKDVPRVVEKIVTIRSECRDLGDDFAGVLNAQIDASNAREDSIADPAPGVVAGVP